MPRLFRTSAIVLGGALLCGIAAWWWRAHPSAKLTFTTTTIKRGDVAATISATGTLEPLEVVDVGAQVAGLVNTFGMDVEGKTVDYGSVVAQGALLAKIDDSVYAADLSVAKAGILSADANVEQMNARLDQAAAEWQRAQQLFDNKLIAQVDDDTAKANYEVAKANVSVAKSGVAQAQADLEKAQRNLDFCTIRSPVSGVIIDRRVNIGQTVVASLNAPSLFLIARDLTKMQIWAAVNEADVGRVKTGTPVTFTVDAFPSRAFEGAVGKVRLNAMMQQNVVLYTVEINVDNAEKLLLPYLTANVRFVLRQETNTLLVSNAALRWSPAALAEVAPEARNSPLLVPGDGNSGTKKSTRTLWLRTGDFVHPLEVTAGISDGVSTAVNASGLQEGDEIVTGEVMMTQKTDEKNPFLPKFIRR